MPKRLEHILQVSAEKRGLKKGTRRYNAYVYGTLTKIKRGKHGA